MREEENKDIIQREENVVDTHGYVGRKLVCLRGQNVLLDADVAEVYGVETKRVNEAVRHNPDKFPDTYIFRLSVDEVNDLRSKISSANISPKSRSLPVAFTEKGLYMLATILRSKRATSATISIIETFASVKALKKELAELHKDDDCVSREDKIKHFGEMLTDIVMPDLDVYETESTLEINFFIGKISHTVKRVKKKQE